MELREGRHPCLSGSDFIPNDVVIGLGDVSFTFTLFSLLYV